MLLCSQHHRLVHEGGFRIEKDYRDRWFFKRADGRAVPSCGYRPADMLDDEVEAEVEYFEAEHSPGVFADPSAEGRRNPSAEGWSGVLTKPTRRNGLPVMAATGGR